MPDLQRLKGTERSEAAVVLLGAATGAPGTTATTVTTLLVCPGVKPWEDFAEFNAFRETELGMLGSGNKGRELWSVRSIYSFFQISISISYCGKSVPQRTCISEEW